MYIQKILYLLYSINNIMTNSYDMLTHFKIVYIIPYIDWINVELYIFKIKLKLNVDYTVIYQLNNYSVVKNTIFFYISMPI